MTNTLSNKLVDTQELLPRPSAEAWEILENCLRAWGMGVPEYMNDTVTAVAAASAIDRGLARHRISAEQSRTTQCSGDMQELVDEFADLDTGSDLEGRPCVLVPMKLASRILSALRTTHSPSEAEVDPAKYQELTTDEKANAMADDCVGDPWELLGYFREKLRQTRQEADAAREAATKLALSLPSDKTVELLREVRTDLRDGMNRADDSRNMRISILRHTIDRALAKLDSHLGEMK